jgi:glycosyltransferase involved in cell wall biosynthesis
MNVSADHLTPTPTATHAPNRAHGRGGVLLVGPLPEEPHTGGIEIGVSMLLRSATAERHAMRLFNTARRRDPSRRLHQRIGYQLGAFARFALAVSGQWPEIVHVKASWGGVNFSQNIGYCMIARLLGRRVLLQLHGGAFDSWYDSRTTLGRWGVRFGLSTASEIVVLSEYWRSMVRSLVAHVPIHVVPNGVELENAVPARNGVGRMLSILTVGTIGHRKGHFAIARAAAEVADLPVRFILAGPDETEAIGTELRELIASLVVGDQIDFIGSVDREQKWQRLAEADIFLLPSHGENMPNALLEAMAAGLPIVCSPVGAIPEMLEDGEGALFAEAGDHEAIAGAIRRLAEDPELRASMSESNRRRVEARFAFPRIAERFDRLYRARNGHARSLAEDSRFPSREAAVADESDKREIALG